MGDEWARETSVECIDNSSQNGRDQACVREGIPVRNRRPLLVLHQDVGFSKNGPRAQDFCFFIPEGVRRKIKQLLLKDTFTFHCER